MDVTIAWVRKIYCLHHNSKLHAYTTKLHAYIKSYMLTSQ